MRVSDDAGPSWFPDFPFTPDKNNCKFFIVSLKNISRLFILLSISIF